MGDGLLGDQFWIVAEHGMQAGYVRNMVNNPRVRIKVRQGWAVSWRTGTANLLPDERQRCLYQQKPMSMANAAVVRLLGTHLLTIRIDLDKAP